MTRLSSFIAPDVNTTSRFDYTAASGQTTFTGADDDGSVLLYQGGFIDVYLNGVRLIDGTDFTTTSDGDSIVLTSSAGAGDILSIVAYGVFDLANHYTKFETDVLLDDIETLALAGI